MTGFDERENAFEAEFAHDAELKFRIEARRDKLVGAWAAEKLGKTGQDAEVYIKTILRADLQEPGDHDVFRRLRADLNESLEKFSDKDIRAEMNRCLAEAITLVKAGS